MSATPPTLPVPTDDSRERPTTWWRDLATLVKPGLNSMVLVTTGFGFVLAHSAERQGPRLVLGGHRTLDFLALGGAIAGTALLAFASAAINQWIEIEPDRLMARTRGRPLPAGRMHPGVAITLGALLAIAGFAILALATNQLTVTLGALSLGNYLLVYTPLKRMSTLNTLAGAVTGALPPMMGWSAASGELGAGAWVLGAILFLWQIPHFLAIAWRYRDDYARGGYRMLPVTDPGGVRTASSAVLYTLGLIPISLLAVITGIAGWLYLAGALVFGLGFLAVAFRFQRRRDEESAIALFHASLIYLPGLLLLMALDPTQPLSRLAE